MKGEALLCVLVALVIGLLAPTSEALGAGEDDTLNGGAGSDALFGDAGADSLNTQDGVAANDSADGGSESDSCVFDSADFVTSCP